MNQPASNPQALIQAAKVQTAANRYGFLRRQADARLVQTIAKS
jgi:hypothetical protein